MFVPGFIQFPPLSTEIAPHAVLMLRDNGRTDGRTDDRPYNPKSRSLPSIVSGGIKSIFSNIDYYLGLCPEQKYVGHTASGRVVVVYLFQQQANRTCNNNVISFTKLGNQKSKCPSCWPS